MAIFCAAAETASAATPLSWSGNVGSSLSTPPVGSSCPTSTLCAGVDSAARVDVSTDAANITSPSWNFTINLLTPAGTAPFSAALTCVSGSNSCVAEDGTNLYAIENVATQTGSVTGVPSNISGGIGPVACPDSTECLAVSGTGAVFVISNPLGTPAATANATLPASAGFGPVTCATTGLCVTFASAGTVYESTDPFAAAATWTSQTLSLAAPGSGPGALVNVSCATISLCAAADNAGEVFVSTNPTAASPAWTKVEAAPIPADPVASGAGVGCNADGYCALVTYQGAVWASATPATAGSWQEVSSFNPSGDPHFFASAAIACAPTSPCVVTGHYPNSLGPSYPPVPVLDVGATSVPVNTAPPGISGQAQVGQTLQELPAAWSGPAFTRSYQWLRCSSGVCSPINGQTATLYTVTSADIGATIEVQETATDASGSATATSAPTGAVPQPQLVNTTPPTITGRAALGHTLTATPGTWSESNVAVTYQWLRCAKKACATIADATGTTYTLTRADVGSTIEVNETAADSAGQTASAVSAPTAAVTHK